MRTAGGEIPVLGVPAPPSVFLKPVRFMINDTMNRARMRGGFCHFLILAEVIAWLVPKGNSRQQRERNV